MGLIAGEGVARGLRAPGALTPRTRRAVCVALGVVGGNLPDADLLVSYDGSPDGLAYLLFHRGHTHTLAGCLALAMLLFAGALAWARWRRLSLTRGDMGVLAVMSAVALLLHLGMDALNNYGVHPFWPVDNRWYYGDAVFIIEPLFWLAIAPLLGAAGSRASRLLLAIPVIGGLALFGWLHAHAPSLVSLAIIKVALLVWLGRRLRGGRAVALSACLALSVGLAFTASSRAVSRELDTIATEAFPGARTVDRVLTPLPTDPRCWEVLLTQEEGGNLVIRRGMMGGDRCRPLFEAAGTAPLVPVPAPSDARVRWLGQVSTPLAELDDLARSHCDAWNLLQFARTPFVTRFGDGRLVGDLRFDREPGPGFAELVLVRPAGAPCRYHAPWVPPRAAELTVVRP